jgi:hypothetical protein
MSFGKKLIAAAAASLMMIGTASADWNGLYAGTFGGITKSPMGGPVTHVSVGAQAGFNFVPGNYLVGLAFDTSAAIIGGAAIICCEATAALRFGAFVGPDVLVYGTIGLGFHYPFMPAPMVTALGAGAELAIGTNLGLFGELRRYRVFGAPPNTAYTEFRIGMNFHQ